MTMIMIIMVIMVMVAMVVAGMISVQIKPTQLNIFKVLKEMVEEGQSWIKIAVKVLTLESQCG